jgi:hypothetical protein
MSANPEDALPYRNLIAGYTDAIRISDFKANIGILFVAFMMGPLVGAYPQLPHFLSPPIILLPFLIVYVCMLLVLLPRYPERGRKNFVISLRADPDDFVLPVSIEQEIETLKMRCSVLSEILYWKTLFLRASFSIAMISTVIAIGLLFYIRFWLR